MHARCVKLSGKWITLLSNYFKKKDEVLFGSCIMFPEENGTFGYIKLLKKIM